MSELGDHLHNCYPPFPCHVCGKREQIDIHVRAVQWRCCGLITPLPPLHVVTGWTVSCRMCQARKEKLAKAAAA